MTAKRDKKRKPKKDERPKVKKETKDLEAKGGEKVKGGRGAYMGPGEQQALIG